MLTYEIIENGNELVSYKYFPEKSKEFGSLTVNKNTKALVSQALAPDDEFRVYLLKMYKRIRKFIDDNHFRETGLVAWY